MRLILLKIRLSKALRMAPNQGPDIVRKWQTFRAAPTTANRTLVEKTSRFLQTLCYIQNIVLGTKLLLDFRSSFVS